ncbi:hypothetical protein BCR44DRAFT_1426920 [Catenaria anguillulae PL171]|uniref:DBF4-type domain-containing protein n=1 Tax=Catenaria anguillulae PL171 TaxID=765915 RepID=A0A1Y2I2K0_9FUNG|nr:hypothetical protein BCR44DRAFT_1426920 [Catenaria anguillulae PL171]
MSFRSHRSAVHPYPVHSNGGNPKSHLGHSVTSTAARPLTANHAHTAMTPRQPFVEIPQSTTGGASASAPPKSQSILHRPASRSASRHGAHRSAQVGPAPASASASAAKPHKQPFRGMCFFFAEEKDGDDSQVTALGGEIRIFFSKDVTHLIVPDAVKAQLPALLSASCSSHAAASAATPAPTDLLLKARPPKHSQPHAAAAATGQPRSTPWPKCVQLNHQVRLHTGRLTASTHPSTLTNAYAHGPGHGQSRTHNNHARLRPLQAPYILVLDKQGHFRPCILKEYTDDADLPRLHRTPQESILSPFQRSSQHAPPVDLSLPGNGVVRPAPAKPNPSLTYLPANPGPPPTEFQLQSRLAQEGARVSSKTYEEAYLHADLDVLKRSERTVRAVLPYAAPRASYCEWCGVRYDNMVEHMASETHQTAIRQPGAWRELDLMIRTYGRKYVEPPGIGPVGKRIASAGRSQDAEPDVVLDLGFVFDDEEEQGIMSDEQVPLELEVPPAGKGDEQEEEDGDDHEAQVHESPLAARTANQRSRRTSAKTQAMFVWNDDLESDDVFGGDQLQAAAPRPATANIHGQESQQKATVRHAAPAAVSLLRSHSQSQMQPPPLSQPLTSSRLVFADPIVSTHASIRSRASLTASGTAAAPGPRPATATPISIPQPMPPPASTLASTSSRRSVSGNNGFASSLVAARTPAPVAPATSTTGYFNLNASGLTPATSQSYSTSSFATTTTATEMYGYTPTPFLAGVAQHPTHAGMGSVAPAALWEYDGSSSRRSAPPSMLSVSAHAGHTPGPRGYLSTQAQAQDYGQGQGQANAEAATLLHMPVGSRPAGAARAGERVDAGGGGDAVGGGCASMSVTGGESVGDRALVSESTLGDFVLTSTGPGHAIGKGGDGDGVNEGEDEDEAAHGSFNETSTSGQVFGEYFDDDDDEEEEESVLDRAPGVVSGGPNENKSPDADEFVHTQTDDDAVQGESGAAVGGATSEDSGSSPRAAPTKAHGPGRLRVLTTSAIAPMHWAATPANVGRSRSTGAAAVAANKDSKPIMYPTPAISGSTHDFDAADIAVTNRASSSDVHVFDFDHMDDQPQEPPHKRQRLGSLRSRRGSTTTVSSAAKHNGLTQVIGSPSVTTRARTKAERESGKDLTAAAPTITSVGRTTRQKLKQQQQPPLSASKAAKSLPTPLTR